VSPSPDKTYIWTANAITAGVAILLAVGAGVAFLATKSTWIIAAFAVLIGVLAAFHIWIVNRLVR
jgi:membrane protein YdbS with pleckstrin-like domain